MYRFSPSAFQEIGKVWNGLRPEDGSELVVADGIPEGFARPDLEEEPQLTAAGIDTEMLKDMMRFMENGKRRGK